MSGLDRGSCATRQPPIRVDEPDSRGKCGVSQLLPLALLGYLVAPYQKSKCGAQGQKCGEQVQGNKRRLHEESRYDVCGRVEMAGEMMAGVMAPPKRRCFGPA